MAVGNQEDVDDQGSGASHSFNFLNAELLYSTVETAWRYSEKYYNNDGSEQKMIYLTVPTAFRSLLPSTTELLPPPLLV